MTIIAFSDIHRDRDAVDAIATAARDHDASLLIGAGDYATMREGLAPIIDAIAAINIPTVLVHGNAETEDELRAAAGPHDHLHILHGSATEIGARTIVGVGGAIPETPFGDWSVDHSEDDAAAWLAPFDHADILVTHSPPRNHADTDSEGQSYGSDAIHEWIHRVQPTLALCGHIHASWGVTSTIGTTKIMNLGPAPNQIELPAL